MGADWFEPKVFFGITFPIGKVKAVRRAIKTNRLVLPKPHRLRLLHKDYHSRAECEDAEDTLERCVGCIGFFGEQRPAKCVAEEERFLKFLEENKTILEECNVSYTGPQLEAGEELDVSSYLVDMPDDEDESGRSDGSDSEDEDDEDEEEYASEDEDRSTPESDATKKV